MNKNIYIYCIIFIIFILLCIYNKNKFNIKKGGNIEEEKIVEEEEKKEQNWFASKTIFSNRNKASDYCNSKRTNLLNSRFDTEVKFLDKDAWYKNDFGYSAAVGQKSGIKKTPYKGPAVCEKNLTDTDLSVNNPITIKNITQNFDNVTHISNFINTDFNYNEFELEFNINRTNKMITNLNGGILTMGSNNSNYHNFLIYIKNTELAIGLMGYNTHISINLNKIKSAVSLYIKLIYKNPYLNIYINARDENEKNIEGYIDYLGNISDKMNTNFRLYLHPFLDAWCSVGTINFITMKENKDNIKYADLSTAKGILNEQQTTMDSLKLTHKKRDKKELYNSENISDIKNYTLQHNLKNIIGFDIKIDTNYNNENGILIKMFMPNKTFLEIRKIIQDDNTFILLNTNNNQRPKTLVKIDYNQTIYSLYLEIVPYMNLHLLCLYINNNFYRYVIDLSDLKINGIYNNFTDLTINEDGAPLITSIKIFTEEFKYKIKSNVEKLYPIVKNENNSLLIKFKKNVKIEYLKLLSDNYVQYHLYVRNNYQNVWKNINTININEQNIDKFKNKHLVINDNTISNEYKLDIRLNKYFLIPLNFVNNQNGILSENTSNQQIFYEKSLQQGQLGTIKIDSMGSPFILNHLFKNEYEIKIEDKTSFKYLYNNIERYIIEQKPNSDYFYIKTANTNKYIYYYKFKQASYLGLSDKNKNCEFKLVPYVPLTLTDSLDELIELYGIEDPYPKIYINNNDLKKSTQPCSYIYSDENIIFKNLPSKIIDIPDDTFEVSNEIEDAKKNQNDLKYNCQDDSVRCEIIRGNMYSNVNKLYNFCSNNLKHYKNKMYRYNYDIDRYYYQDNNTSEVYDEKQRVKLGELSKKELEEVLNIEKLAQNINIISSNTNRNLVNTQLNKQQFKGIFDIFSDLNQGFKIQRDSRSSFRSPLLINIKTNNGYLKNIKIISDVFKDRSMKEHTDQMKTNLISKLQKNIIDLKKNKPFLTFGEWEGRPEGFECPYTLETEKTPDTCCDLEDNCNVIDLLSYLSTDCNQKKTNSKNKFNLAKAKIAERINILLRNHGQSRVTLKNWTNLAKFIDNTFQPEEIKNTPGLQYLKNAYKTFKGTTTYNNISTKSAASLVNAQAANSTAIFGGNTKKSLKGGNKDKDKLKSYYFEYTKDTNKFIKQNMLKVIQEQNSVIEKKNRDSNKPKNLIDLYIKKQIPILEYTNPDVGIPEECWRLEWSGIYEPDNTEFQLYNLTEKKYLISEDNMLKWSNDQVMGKGWKLKQNNQKSNIQTMEEKMELLQKKKEDLKTVIINELKTLFKTDIVSIIQKSNTKTIEIKDKYNKDYKKQLDDNRKDDIKSLSNSSWLFSPNIGTYGEFFIPTPHSTKNFKGDIKWFKNKDNIWFDFGGYANPKYKVQFVVWGSEGPEFEKSISKEDNIVAISRKIGSQRQYLKNKPSGINALEWTPEWSLNIRWEFDWDDNKKLEVNLNTMEAPDPIQGEQEINSKYKLVSNKKITIRVGNRVKIPATKWINQYMAIKAAEEKGFIGCLDYSWVAEEKGQTVYYDDNYSSKINNTLTRAWFVMDKNSDITEKYLAFNKLKYEIHIATQHTYTYPQCSYQTRRYRRWWRWRYYRVRVCNTISRSWGQHGVNIGMNSWKGNAKHIPPSDEWSARQDEMLRDLYKIYKKCTKPNNKPIYIYLKSLGNNKYLQSDTIGVPKFTNLKRREISGWHVLMQYKSEDRPAWLINHINNMKQFQEYSTLIKKEHYCPIHSLGTNDYDGHSLYLKGTPRYNQSVEDCARAVREWQYGKNKAFKYFVHRVGKPNSWNGKHRCYGVNMVDICMDHRYGESKLIRDSPSDPRDRFSLYKLDDEPPMDF